MHNASRRYGYPQRRIHRNNSGHDTAEEAVMSERIDLVKNGGTKRSSAAVDTSRTVVHDTTALDETVILFTR